MALRCTRPGLLRPLQRLCDGQHAHVPVMGGQLARRPALYTPSLCRAERADASEKDLKIQESLGRSKFRSTAKASRP